MNVVVSQILWALGPGIAIRVIMRSHVRITGKNMSLSAMRMCRTLISVLIFVITVVPALSEVYSAGTHNTSFYNTLGIDCDASNNEVARRFRRLAVLHHPDKQLGAQTVGEMYQGPLGPKLVDDDLFLNISRARDVLTDPLLRFAYDRRGNAYVATLGGDDPQPSMSSAVRSALIGSFGRFCMTILTVIVGWVSGLRQLVVLRVVLSYTLFLCDAVLNTSSRSCWSALGTTFQLTQALYAIGPRLGILIAQLGNIFGAPETNSVAQESAQVNYLAKILLHELELDLDTETSPFCQPEQRDTLKSLVVDKIIDYDVYLREEVASASTSVEYGSPRQAQSSDLKR